MPRQSSRRPQSGSEQKPATDASVAPGSLRPHAWKAVAAVSVIAVVVALAWLRYPGEPAPSPGSGATADPPSEVTNSALPAGLFQIEGRWVRPDGGYTLELRNAAASGSLQASYSNPQPIRVSQAAWKEVNGHVRVLVELRDVNYPGSTYTLDYDPATDRLGGEYFQAMLGETYDVYFVRASN